MERQAHERQRTIYHQNNYIERLQRDIENRNDLCTRVLEDQGLIVMKPKKGGG
jgi:hypothetical protein